MNETNQALRGQFIGHTPQKQGVAGVTLAEVVHTHGRELPPHLHADPYLALLVTGHYEDVFGGHRREFGPADASYSPPGFEHRDRIGSGGATFFTVSFDPAAGAEYTERRALWETPQQWSGFGPAYVLARLHVRFMKSGRRLDAMDVDNALCDLWAGLAPARPNERRTAAWLERAREQLHDRFVDPPRVTELAAEASVHPTYFTRAFRKRFGVGPAEYRNRLRVVAACRALAARGSIQGIAIGIGYADHPHMTRDFARRIGVAPAEYRRIIRAA